MKTVLRPDLQSHRSLHYVRGAETPSVKSALYTGPQFLLEPSLTVMSLALAQAKHGIALMSCHPALLPRWGKPNATPVGWFMGISLVGVEFQSLPSTGISPNGSLELNVKYKA